MNTPTDHDQQIADRDRIIAKLRAQLTAALDEVVRLREARNSEGNPNAGFAVSRKNP